LFAFIFGVYAFYATKRRNRAIEKWRYGLPGTGLANPRKLGLELKGPDASRKPFIGWIRVEQRDSEARPPDDFSTRLNEGFQLVGDTTANFVFAGLFLGLGVFTDSQFFRLICQFSLVYMLWLGYMRPAHASPRHRLILVIGAVPCLVAGFSARWFFAAHGFIHKVLILGLLLATLAVGYMILLCRQSSVLGRE
jgi:hypothetical protein